ncbi:heavy metal translocating P-type ATPase [Brachybacterium epidermidis]|uniref:heavy metal translocating P-type ATPase n=1 Tax=Brachybacterium epidermidis TaxID=2781983 RepID=UPI001D13346D|nr:cation-translocating P-type ATPase [Brachybacterium epidermidis]
MSSPSPILDSAPSAGPDPDIARAAGSYAPDSPGGSRRPGPAGPTGRPARRGQGLLPVRAWVRPGIAAVLIGLSWLLDALTGSPATGSVLPGPAGLLMVGAALVSGTPILIAAVRALRHRVVGIDLLVSIATIGAIVIGEYWEAAAVTTLFAIGHALEKGTLQRTRRALTDLVSTAPEQAVVLRDGTEQTIAATEVRQGEQVLVRPGTRVPVDGHVLAGRGAIDEAGITGESVPAEKSEGDPVYAGTVATGGLLTVLAEGIGADTTLARIIRRVEEAQDAKAPTQAFMDRFARWYTPAIIVLSVVFGVLTGDVELALTLLVISCPGALVISIPVAIVAGIGRGARDGMLIKGGEHLETSARIDTVALDKTGTLTTGRPVLTDVLPLPGRTREEVLLWAARAELTSDHPLAAPVVWAARAEGLDLGQIPEQADAVVGRGVLARHGGHAITVGSQAMLHESDIGGSSERREAIDLADETARRGRTPMIVTLDETVLGVIGLADTPRAEAADAITALRRAGVREVVMLTGDQPRVAQAVAAEVGIDTVHAGLLPEGKLDQIAALQARGRTVAMVGDGVNDAPALASADIGISMGAAGSAVAIETSDIALMRDSLSALAQSLRLARRTVAVMRQNIVIALVTVGMLLLGVLLGGVTMSLGMLVHEASVLLVIVNAMRLLRPVRG